MWRCNHHRNFSLLRVVVLWSLIAITVVHPVCGQRGNSNSNNNDKNNSNNNNNKNSDDINLLTYIEAYLTNLGSESITQQLFKTQTYEISKIYKFQDLLSALPVVHNEGIANSHFYLGESSLELGHEYGLVNLAAFLAQCMKETIQYDACDENNWDLFHNQYPLSNACGQLGQSYQDYTCPPHESHMECPLDPQMKLTATTHATWYGAPGPFFCAPKSEVPHTGFWDYTYWCHNPWNDPPESCDVYEGQKSGRFDNEEPVASRGGRTDVEGCCWWGRGVIQTTGRCNFGKLNYYLGAKAAADGRDAKYPEIDFCKTPDIICSSDQYSELKWIAGLYYWMKDVQEYNQDGWYYKTELHKFVNSGMTDMGFIDAISGIVNRGCHNPPCATGNVDGLEDRRSNFKKVLMAFKLPSVTSRPPSTLPPIPAPLLLPSLPAASKSPELINALLHRLNSQQYLIEQKTLSYFDVNGVKTLSDIYTFNTLIESIVYSYEIGHAGGKRFYIGPPPTPTGDQTQSTTTNNLDLRYGLVNIAAFLAQSHNEGILANACDEYHLDAIDGKYPISNSCGQFGDDYQEYTCSSYAERAMECPSVPTMNAAAASSGKYADSLYEHRPNFYCGPDEEVTGAFNPETMMTEVGPSTNSAGRTDVKGCCFWGRGALLTKGACMLGKLNHYLGAGAAKNGRLAMYPNVDFCGNPGSICASIKRHPTLVWDIALFEWIERIQTYNDGNFNYQDALNEFVAGGMTDTSFINTVSKIVARGSSTSFGPVPYSGQRLSHFNLLLEHLQLKINYPHRIRWSDSRQQVTKVPLWMTIFEMTMLWLV